MTRPVDESISPYMQGQERARNVEAAPVNSASGQAIRAGGALAFPRLSTVPSTLIRCKRAHLARYNESTFEAFCPFYAQHEMLQAIGLVLRVPMVHTCNKHKLFQTRLSIGSATVNRLEQTHRHHLPQLIKVQMFCDLTKTITSTGHMCDPQHSSNLKYGSLSQGRARYAPMTQCWIAVCV